VTLHRHSSRSQIVIDKVNTWGRKLGRVQTAVLKSLLERGTYPGTWYWKNSNTTLSTLQGLEKRGLVVTEEVDVTDMRGDPGPSNSKTIFYRPAQWMRDAMDAPSNDAALAVLEDALPVSKVKAVGTKWT
jgi:hypothetical protein